MESIPASNIFPKTNEEWLNKVAEDMNRIVKAYELFNIDTAEVCYGIVNDLGNNYTGVDKLILDYKMGCEGNVIGCLVVECSIEELKIYSDEEVKLLVNRDCRIDRLEIRADYTRVDGRSFGSVGVLELHNTKEGKDIGVKFVSDIKFDKAIIHEFGAVTEYEDAKLILSSGREYSQCLKGIKLK